MKEIWYLFMLSNIIKFFKIFSIISYLLAFTIPLFIVFQIFIQVNKEKTYEKELNVALQKQAVSDIPKGYNNSHPVDLAFDNDNFTFWHTCKDLLQVTAAGGFPHYIGQDFGTHKIINRYTIKYRNNKPDQAPSYWELQASNTGEWTGEEITYDIQKNITSWDFNDAKIFSIKKPPDTGYRYWRVYIHEVNDGGANNFCSISHIMMYAKEIEVSGKKSGE